MEGVADNRFHIATHVEAVRDKSARVGVAQHGYLNFVLGVGSSPFDGLRRKRFLLRRREGGSG